MLIQVSYPWNESENRLILTAEREEPRRLDPLPIVFPHYFFIGRQPQPHRVLEIVVFGSFLDLFAIGFYLLLVLSFPCPRERLF